VFDISLPLTHFNHHDNHLFLWLCMSLGIDDVAGAAFEACVQIKFTIMTTQMDSVMGHAAKEIGS